MIQGPQKQCSQVSDMQIHKYKYTNTQLQLGSKLQLCIVIVGKSDFEYGILMLGSIFPNFPEYFSEFFGVFFRIFPSIFPN